MNPTPNYTIRPVTGADREWIKSFSETHWGSDLMVVRGEAFYVSQMEGFVAETAGQPDSEVVGLVTYRIQKSECEVTSLDSLREGMGIGTALIKAVKVIARQNGCRRLHLTTTNDNINALRFYQKQGFALAELRRNAVTEARKIKPQIPLIGDFGIPLRDEIELEIDLLDTNS